MDKNCDSNFAKILNFENGECWEVRKSQ